MRTAGLEKPVYLRIKADIEKLIDQGVYRSGGLVPGERELAVRLGAATGTVRKAIGMMVSEGKLVRMPRKGTVVSPGLPQGNGRETSCWLVVVPVLHYFYPLLISYIELETRKIGVSLMVACTYNNLELEREHIWRGIENGARGLLIAPATQANGRPRETLDYLAELPVPAVIMDHWGINLPITGIDCVLSDNYAGTYQATVHMIRHGYRKISVAQGDPASSPEMSERNRGYVSALTDHGLKVPDLPRISTDDLGRGRLDALKKHLEWGTQGFVVGNDRSASTMIRRLTEMGYKVPEQIGVIGYDDEPFATALCPKLSSVRVEKGEIARRAVGMLRERIETGSKGRHKMVVLRPTVVVRQSCGPNCPDPYVPDLEEFTEVDQLEASALV